VGSLACSTCGHTSEDFAGLMDEVVVVDPMVLLFASKTIAFLEISPKLAGQPEP